MQRRRFLTQTAAALPLLGALPASASIASGAAGAFAIGGDSVVQVCLPIGWVGIAV